MQVKFPEAFCKKHLPRNRDKATGLRDYRNTLAYRVGNMRYQIRELQGII